MPAVRPALIPALAALAGGLLGCIVLGQLTGVALAGAFGLEGDAAAAFLRTPGALALMTTAQYAAMVGLATFVWAGARSSPGGRSLAFAALGGASTVGVAAGVGAILLRSFPGLELGGLADLGLAFTEGPWAERVALALAIALAAPVAEELIFRGALWDLLERRWSAPVAFVLTSVLFAAWHIRLFHVLSLVPTAFLLGWLRYRTGSVHAPIVAHVVNNGVGAAILLGAGPAGEPDLHVPSFAAGVVAYGITVVALGRADPPTPHA